MLKIDSKENSRVLQSSSSKKLKPKCVMTKWRPKWLNKVSELKKKWKKDTKKR